MAQLPSDYNLPVLFPKNPSLFYRVKSRVTLTVVFMFTKFMFCGLNKLVVSPNRKVFVDLLEDESKPLITISNHRCNVDDPLIWSMLTFREFFRNIFRFRYTLAAHNICFTRDAHTQFFSLGRCVPCIRGAGVFQASMDFCVDVLSRNGWIHMFPEGKVTKVPIRIKWGISRLIVESKIPPTLLPIWVNGMQDVWPEQAPYFPPKFGKTVEVIIGTPIDTSEILKNLKGTTELERRKEIADIVQLRLFELGKVQPTAQQ